MITLEVEEPAIRLFGSMIQVQRAPNDDVLALCYSAGSVFIQAASSSSSSSSTKSSMVSKVSRAVSPCSEEQELKKRSKKQSKLLLACPRCKSGATKFCYFNNYNSKQPRHFCKGCQRYWTAGGSMRSMVVGAGRRKLKKPAAAANSSFWPSCAVYDGSQKTKAALATISMQSFSPIWPNTNCGFFAVPVYAATAAPCWAWVDPRVPLKESSSSVWAPKTVRFDDASDMAKATFWSTLGI